MESIWTIGMEKTNFPPLIGEIDADILIIGGGMAGMLCAHELKNAGADCVVLEAGRVGRSVTAGTTAVISAQHGTLYTDMAEKYGKETAKGYLEANLKAVEDFRTLCSHIDCDFEDRPSLMYTTHRPERLRREVKTLNDLGFGAFFTENVPLVPEARGAVVFPGMAQFHPLKLLPALAEGIKIHELSVVRKVKEMRAYTDGGSVKARRIIIASHFPFLDRRGLYFMKMRQKRECVVAVENIPPLDVTAVEDTKAGIFFRSYKNTLLVGCGNFVPGRESDDFSNIKRFLSRRFPGAREVCRWVNQDCFTLDGIPYIGEYSPATPDIFVATGFNAWGMTSSMAAAKLLAAKLTGSNSPYERVFAPARPMEVLPLLENAASSTVHLATPTLPRCSHLGCALKFNQAEQTWDCPCHGSRFSKDGAVLLGPASKKAKVGRSLNV